jgi:hypothetical protein
MAVPPPLERSSQSVPPLPFRLLEVKLEPPPVTEMPVPVLPVALLFSAVIVELENP